MEFNEHIGENSENLELKLEEECLEPRVMDIPEVGEVLVSGDPFELAKNLDSVQGDNIYNARGDCGLVSVCNILRMCGFNVDENEIVGRALERNLCFYEPNGSPEKNGGTYDWQRQMLLGDYGIRTEYHSGTSASPEMLARYVEAGHGVNLSVNAGYLWDKVNAVGIGRANHSIIVTGTARDPATGELKGLFVCDSGCGRSDSGAMFVSLEKLEMAYSDVGGSSALITKEPIR